MSDKKIQQYKYDEMSNKVLRADKRLMDDPKARAERDINSVPESLVGKISVKDMGSRAHASKPEISEEEKKKFATRNKSRINNKNDSNSKKVKSQRYNGNANLFDIESLNYVPKTAENQAIYDELLSWSSNQLDNDASQDVIRSLTDLILEVLYDENLTDINKKAKCEELLEHPLNGNDFQEALSLSKQITDYRFNEDSAVNGNEEQGIAVVFDEDDDNEDEMIDEGEDDDEGEEEEEDDDDHDDDNDNDEHKQLLEPEEEVVEVTNHDNFEKNSVEQETKLVKIENSSKNSTNNQHDLKSLLGIQSIDKFWLTRELSSIFKNYDSYKNAELAKKIFILLDDTVSGKIDTRILENELMELLEFEHFDFIENLMKNYNVIYYGIRLSSLDKEEDKVLVFQEIEKKGLNHLVEEYTGKLTEIRGKRNEPETAEVISEDHVVKKRKLEQQIVNKRQPRLVDLDALVFDEGSHLRTSSTLKLPKGAYKLPKKYEEIHIPAPEPPAFAEDERLIPIKELDEWIQPVFPEAETATLNRIQSKVYPTAFRTDENILLCAPTGGGKTNVAMLAILRTLSNYRDKDTGKIDLNGFKIVYIAPLKALVQEQVREFQRRLSQFGIVVNELSGDSNLTKQQISTTQILVTTPEKWDVITRKMSDGSYVNLVRLIIIDEIHLLHDERGPVLESIVARTIRNTDSDSNEEPVRLIGLSATLPNYQDVAMFLRVDQNKGLFYFDATYRPCPLSQQFVGINEKRALKRYQANNEVCYEKILESVSEGNQVIVFVHSRKDTFKTAKWIRDKLLENNQLNKLLKSDSGSIEILKQESENCKDSGLKDLLPTGFALHHAGLNRSDRSLSEDLFAAGYIQVLVSTSTLAWGVNLPAHTVIIKGTNVYSPEKGTWVELSAQDILQMLGRAGRPRYDKSGEGIIITSQDEIQYYLAILNQQLPIESQMMGKLVNSLNAEVVLGNVKSRDDCVDWLGYTYLFVRMLHSPVLYHVGPEYKDDKLLTEKREDLVHSALTILDKNKLIIYDANTGSITSTELGKIASYYYISYESMNLYNQQLKFFSSPIDILRIFAQSGEFKYIPVRQEEKMEVSKLLEKAPIPIKEAAADPLAKINVLLQSYISRLKLDGFALVADMVYIVQSAGRLLRAIYEIALKKKWSALTRTLLNLSKMVDKRMWLSNSPFRQFPNVPYEIIRKTENSQMPWSHYFNLSDPAEMSQAIRSEKYGRTAFELLKSFPRLTMAATAQPITPSLLRVELEVLPEWDWNVEIHGYAESFLLLVEDCNGENILFNDTFLVRKNYINQEHVLEFTVPILEPLQPNYFISLISERWLHCEAKIPLRFGRLKVPKKFPAPTQLLNLQLTPVTDLKIKEFENVFGFEYFNKFQTQAFQSLYNSNENVLIGMSKGSGKTVCAELSLLNHWKQSKGRAVYISPSQEKIGYTYKDWKKRFSGIAGGKLVDKLTGELTQDLKILENSHLILSTPQQFDTISRRWKYRKNIQQIGLFIIDDCHTIGNGYAGTVYEVIISRMRFIHARLENDLRIVGLTTSLANGKDFAEWIGVSKNNLFNFSSKERINPLEIRLQSFDIHHNPSLILSMIRPIFQAVAPYSEGESNVTIFVPSRKHCVEISAEFVKSANSHDIDFLKTDLESIEPFLVKISDAALKESLTNGIGYYYKDMLPGDKSTVEKLFNAGVLSILFATRETCFTCPVANFVVVLSTQYYEGKEHRYIDYPINELLEMIGTSVADEGGSAKCAILTNSSKRDYYKKFLNEPLPVESHLNIFLHDALINEITTKTVNSRQDCIDWLTFSYFYRRLQFNPSFYGVENTSHLGISEYLSELIENTLKDLVDAKLVEVEDDEEEEEEEEEENKDDEESEAKVEIVALNGAMIAAYYNISFISMQTFTLSLTNKTKLKGLLEIITSASELEAIPVRKHEDEILSKIYNRLPIKSSNPNYESPFFKSFILLQAHFSRIHLPHDLVSDQKFILEKILNLLYACIDILSSEGYLNAITAMDISQMIVQAVWDSDPPLKQIPFFSADILERCASAKVESVYDIMTLEDDERNNILKLSDRELSKVAEFVNNYPNVDLSYQLDTSEPMIANEDREIIVTLERDEEVDDLTVVAPHYPFKKLENWWVVVGDPKMRQLYAIKRTTIPGQSKQIKLDFSIPTAGHHKLSIWCMCDSYVDADKELSFEIDVEESEDAENKSDANSED